MTNLLALLKSRGGDVYISETFPGQKKKSMGINGVSERTKENDQHRGKIEFMHESSRSPMLKRAEALSYMKIIRRTYTGISASNSGSNGSLNFLYTGPVKRAEVRRGL